MFRTGGKFYLIKKKKLGVRCTLKSSHAKTHVNSKLITRILPSVSFQITFCGNFSKESSSTVKMLLSRLPNVAPNETTITPLSPELCINSSSSDGSGLDGPVRSGPTTLVSAEKDKRKFQHKHFQVQVSILRAASAIVPL